MFDLILLGDPASGKATQAHRIAAKYKMFNFDMGEELRKLKRKPKIKAMLAKTLDQGKLTPTELVRGILKEKVLKTSRTKGILFNGHPKMVGEAKLLEQLMKKAHRSADRVLVLYVTIPKQEMIKRTLGRGRTDDDRRALENRLKYYRLNIAGVVKFFRSKYTFKDINGMGSRTEVHARIQKAISQFRNH